LLIAIDRKRPLTTFLLALLAFNLYLAHPLWWLVRYGFYAMAGLVFMESAAYSLAFLIYNFIRDRSQWRDPCLLTLPMLIVIVEFKRSIGPWAFPWSDFAHTQWGNLMFIQGASIWGALGVGFLVVWINVFLYQLIKAFPNQPVKLAVGLPLIGVVMFNLLYGHNMLLNDDFKNSQAYPTTITQRAGLTDVAWTLNYNDKAWMDYHNLTRSEIDKTQGLPGFVLWPENAIPDLLENRLEGLEHLANVSKKAFIVGTLTYKPEDADYNRDYNEPWFNLYNSNVSVSPDYGYCGTYSKVHLVPFGESIPMREYLAILEYPWGDKNLKEGRIINALTTPYGGAGTMVCYESFFPQISRMLILDGAKYLFLSSNTSWFGDSIATWQHARYDVFRAIENGCYFARAATTGVSSIIDPRGRILHETKTFVSESFTENIHPLEPNHFGAATIYTVTGDWLAYVSLIWFVLTLMRIFRPKSAKPLSETIAYIED
ncbi:apolipoprotein N-acyltransferase, partial [bacterium]|nr:apolipoprotein N-acyltransferase [bacterium]MBU1025007.1 apolipoprotein N-acyltransferase [bacterium]